MQAIIKGLVYVLGDDVDTDQIIPAQHLVLSLSDPKSRKRYGGLALSGVPTKQAGLPRGGIGFADPITNQSPYSIIVAGRNFGCGSSREHAPVALSEAGIFAVVACSYARIFYRNAVDGGYFPPFEIDQPIWREFCTGDEVEIDTLTNQLLHKKNKVRFTLKSLGAAGDIVRAGGIFAYARSQGMI